MRSFGLAGLQAANRIASAFLNVKALILVGLTESRLVYLPVLGLHAASVVEQPHFFLGQGRVSNLHGEETGLILLYICRCVEMLYRFVVLAFSVSSNRALL